MQPSSGHLSQSIISLLVRSKRVYLEGFNKGSEGPFWYECLLLLSVLFKNSRREAFQIEVQLLFPEAFPDRALPWSLSNLWNWPPGKEWRKRPSCPTWYCLVAQKIGSGTVSLSEVTELLLIWSRSEAPLLAVWEKKLDWLPDGDIHCEYISSQTCLRRQKENMLFKMFLIVNSKESPQPEAPNPGRKWVSNL